MKIYERFVSGFLVGFRFVAFGFGGSIHQCVAVSVSCLSLSPKSLNYFSVKFKIATLCKCYVCV